MKESALQRELCDYLRICCPDVICWHIPNAQIMSGIIRKMFIVTYGKDRGLDIANKVLGKIVNFLKSIGLTPGAPDLDLRWKGGALLAELKTDNGSITAEQKETHDRLRALGHPVVVLRSLDDLKSAILLHGIPCRDAFLRQSLPGRMA